MTEPSPTPSTLFITDYQASSIVRYNGVTGELVDVFASGAANHVDRPANVRVGPDGNLYLAGFGQGDIVRFELASGSMMDVFYHDTALLEEPVELLFHGDELVLLGNDTQNTVIVSRDGVARRSFGSPTMRAAHDFAFGPDGLLYVATETHPALSTAIQAWDLATGSLVRSFGAPDCLSYASSVAFDPNGDLLASDLWSGHIERFDPSTGRHLGTLVDGLDTPVSIDFAPDGKLYVLDRSAIYRFTSDGTPDGLLLAIAPPLERPRGFTFVAN